MQKSEVFIKRAVVLILVLIFGVSVEMEIQGEPYVSFLNVVACIVLAGMFFAIDNFLNKSRTSK